MIDSNSIIATNFVAMLCYSSRLKFASMRCHQLIRNANIAAKQSSKLSGHFYKCITIIDDN